MLMLRWCLIAAVAALLPGCSGSGPDRAEVSGTVQVDGEPVKEGSIRFIPTEGTSGPDGGGVIVDGKYHLARSAGPVIGKSRVELRAFKKTSRQVQDPTAPQGTKTTEVVPLFPPAYNDQSTIVKEIQAGSNTIDFDIRLKEGGK